MDDNKAVLYAVGKIFILGVGDDLLQIFGFLQAKLMAADRMTVFGMVVRLILAAVHENAPNRADAEGIIGMPVFGRREIRDILGIEARVSWLPREKRQVREPCVTASQSLKIKSKFSMFPL